MGAPLCHFELMSDDPEKCKAFYGKVFGWQFDDSSMPGYTLINPGAEPNGGLMKRSPDAPHVAMSVYFQVDDIGEILGKVAEGGGQVLVPKTEIPNVGFYAMFADPEGIPVGVFQS